MNRAHEVVILAAIAAYVIASLPVIDRLIVIVLGLLFASFTKNPRMRDLGYKVLGAVNRIVFSALSKQKSQGDVREKAIQMCAAIDQYPNYMKSLLNRKRRLFFMLDKTQQSAAAQTYKRIQETESYAELNFEALSQVKSFFMNKYSIPQRDLWGHASNAYNAVELIEHFVRDWSESNHHGKARDDLFAPLWPYLANKKRVLVPGSGVGRLPFDIAQRLGKNVIVDAPEMSPFMHFGSLYATSGPLPRSVKLYPYLLEFSYLKERENQFNHAVVEFPQLKPKMNIPCFFCQDFLTFDRGYKYDAVVTVFFIDTAQNVFRYIDRIAEMLSPGGVWLNYGPLKWGSAAFIEFSTDEFLSYLANSGWITERIWSGTNRYNGSEKSMLKTEYELIGWSARRK